MPLSTSNSTDDYTFRQLVPSDLPALYDIRFSVQENRIHPHQVHLLDRSLLLNQISQGGGCICESKAEQTAVGICLPIMGERPMIAVLFIRPTHHRRGIGKVLLQSSLDWLRNQGATEAYLVTDPGSGADRFYQSLGWHRGGFDQFGVQIAFTLPL
ncbi:GNAT family N-acetyltransferase [Paraburkholderia megapolitana]|uniref:GNAT family N-acetyltransferase n=1 Tax=Paraburkholderia megapolitana TaxID=420953 RepID=UPI0038BA0A3E